MNADAAHGRRPLLSLCMIVKNESANLPRCLSSARSHVDEMIVVDTGSEDDTVEVARQYGARVSFFDWCDDFAAARNAALDQARGEWILVLDGDEELSLTIDLRQLLQDSVGVLSYLTLFVNVYDGDRSKSVGVVRRLFRNLPGVRYIGRFHEQVIYPGEERGLGTNISTELIKILHYGYAPEVWTDKLANRNIPILESLRTQGEASLMVLTCLADMYTAVGEQEKSQDCYQAAYDRLLPYLLAGECPPETILLRFLLQKLTWQALEAEDYETARLCLQNGLHWLPDYPPLSYLAGLNLFYLGFPRGAIAYFEECLSLYRENRYTRAESFETAYMTSHPAFSLGYSWMKLKEWQKAAEAFKLCLSFDPNYGPALERLAEISPHLNTQASEET
uniref:Glycosyl transferase family 2 n=1 Tax=Cyanothece sp. (strain PCC 7425 / ATCC 29141) TaxID=395961 RepID=B8HX22_CYAP4